MRSTEDGPSRAQRDAIHGAQDALAQCAHRLKKLYGLSLEDYDAILEVQGFSQSLCDLDGLYCLKVFPVPMKFPTRETDHTRMIRSAVSIEAIATAGTHFSVQGIDKIKGT